MAFDLSRAAIVQPTDFGRMMGEFVGPASIKGPFQEGLARKEALEAGIFESGMGELGANRRVEMTNDAAAELAKENRDALQKSNRLAGVTRLLAAGDIFGGSTGGRNAGQVFGVGDGRTATQRMTQDTNDQAASIEAYLRYRNAANAWSSTSRGMTTQVAGASPKIPGF